MIIPKLPLSSLFSECPYLKENSLYNEQTGDCNCKPGWGGNICQGKTNGIHTVNTLELETGEKTELAFRRI